MKLVKKVVPIALSLALCASMVAPAFAATFTELQGAINTGESVYNGDGDCKIEASKDETGAVNVKLYEDVNAEKGETGIVITGTVTIDLNGNDIDLNPNAVLNAEDGKFYEAEEDEDGNKIATENVATNLNSGSVIDVKNGGELTLSDSAATGTAGSEEDPYISGKITGGRGMGGGIKLNAGKLTMNGGAVSGNYSGWRGGGVCIEGNTTSGSGEFEMNDGVISGNYVAADGGGGVYSHSCIFADSGETTGGKFVMRGGAIEGNGAAGGSGGGLQANGSSETILIGGTIKNNAAGRGCDVYFSGGKVEGSSGSRWLIDNGSDKNVMQEYMIPEDGVIPASIGLKSAELDEDGNIIVPVGKTVIDKDGKEWGEDELPFGGIIDKDGNVIPNPDPSIIPEPTPVTTNPTTEIDDVAVPLASGPVTRAQFIDYLWRYEGKPDSDGVCTFTDVPADHEFILALAWAEETGIAVADEDGSFEPDELVTVAAVREFLGNYAVVFELDVDVYALTTLVGEDDEAVLNCDEVIEEFFDLVEALDQAA